MSEIFANCHGFLKQLLQCLSLAHEEIRAVCTYAYTSPVSCTTFSLPFLSADTFVAYSSIELIYS